MEGEEYALREYTIHASRHIYFLFAVAGISLIEVFYVTQVEDTYFETGKRLIA